MQAEFNQSAKIQGDKLTQSAQESSKVLEFKAPVYQDLEKKQGDALLDAIPKGYANEEVHHVPKGRATLPEYHQGEAEIKDEVVKAEVTADLIASDLIEDAKADLKLAADIAATSTEIAKEKAAVLYSSAIDKAYQGEQYLMEKAIDGEHYLEEKGKQALEAAKSIGGSLLSSAAAALYSSAHLAKEGLEVAEVKAVEGASVAIEYAKEGAVIAKEKALDASVVATEYAKEGLEFAKKEAYIATEKASDAATYATTKASDLTHQAADAATYATVKAADAASYTVEKAVDLSHVAVDTVTGVAAKASQIPATATAYIAEKKEEFVHAGEYEMKAEFGSVLRQMANTQLQLKSIEDQKAAEFMRVETERLEAIKKEEEHVLRQARFLAKEREMESRLANSMTSSLRQTASEYEEQLLEEGRSDELLETYTSSPIVPAASASPAVFATKSEMMPLLQDPVAEPLSPMTM